LEQIVDKLDKTTQFGKKSEGDHWVFCGVTEFISASREVTGEGELRLGNYLRIFIFGKRGPPVAKG